VLSFLFGKDSAVGIDIGSRTIKAVEVEPYGNGWRLTNAALQPTPPDSCRDGVITNIFDVSQAIRKLLNSANIKSTLAVAAISGSQVIVRQCQFPKMSEATMRKSIRFEAGKHISASIEDSIIEFEILGDVPDSVEMNVMLVAAPRELVDSRVGVLEAAGLEPVALDVEAFALIRSLVEVAPSNGFNGNTTDVNIVSNGEFALTRSIPIAGDSFTNAIKTLTGLAFEDAERLKFEMAIQDSADRLNVQEADNKSWKVVQPLLDELLREIRRSVHYYQSQFPEGSDQAAVSKIILSGGTAKMSGIAAYVSGKLGVPTEVADPFAEGGISAGRFAGDFIDDHGPVLTIATGLALKEELVKPAAQAAA